MSINPLAFPRISLVIPSYNRADLIAETIDSALAQSWPLLEIIVADDASTDNTAEILSRFGDKVRVLTLPKGGVQAARNAGVAAAHGEYVALCDSDDLLTPDYAETVSRWLEKHPVSDAIYCNFTNFDANGQHPDKFSLAPPDFFAGSSSEGDFLYDIPDLYLRTLSFQPLFATGGVFRTSFYKELGGFDTRFNRVGGEDWEFTLRAVAAGRVSICRRPLARIRRHLGNESTDSMRQVMGTALILEHALEHHAVAAKYHEAIRAGIEARRADVFHAAFARGRFDVAHEMLALMQRRPTDARFRLKALIARLPAALRAPVWRATQRS